MNKKNDRRRRIFSISQEFEEEVNDILDNTPNYSRFVCEAILEKYQRENNPDETFEKKVRQVLFDIMSSNEVFKGKDFQSLSIPKTNNVNALEDINNQETNKEIIKAKNNILEDNAKKDFSSKVIKKEEITKEDVLGHELEEVESNNAPIDEVEPNNAPMDEVAKLSKKAFDNW